MVQRLDTGLENESVSLSVDGAEIERRYVCESWLRKIAIRRMGKHRRQFHASSEHVAGCQVWVAVS